MGCEFCCQLCPCRLCWAWLQRVAKTHFRGAASCGRIPSCRSLFAGQNVVQRGQQGAKCSVGESVCHRAPARPCCATWNSGGFNWPSYFVFVRGKCGENTNLQHGAAQRSLVHQAVLLEPCPASRALKCRGCSFYGSMHHYTLESPRSRDGSAPAPCCRHRPLLPPCPTACLPVAASSIDFSGVCPSQGSHMNLHVVMVVLASSRRVHRRVASCAGWVGGRERRVAWRCRRQLLLCAYCTLLGTLHQDGTLLKQNYSPVGV